MSSVTKRIEQIKQPRGGYLPVKDFSFIELDDGNVLNEETNISPILIGLAVDYLTRFMLENKAEQAFEISLTGAKIANAEEKSQLLLANVKGLDDQSITCACKLTSFDVWYRNPMFGPRSATPDEVNPDSVTIENIRILVNRSIDFLKKYGPVIKSSFEFDGGYTDQVNSGDGDYLTKDGIWDLKVRKSKITTVHTLQILMYWIMGKHSKKREFDDIRQIGIFNAFQNAVYSMKVSDIPSEIIRTVETEVIGYTDSFIGEENGDSTLMKCFYIDDEDGRYYSLTKIPYAQVSRYSGMDMYFRMEKYGEWPASWNKKRSKYALEDICKLIIVNRIADAVEQWSDDSINIYIKDANPRNFARINYFLFITGMMDRKRNGKLCDDSGFTKEADGLCVYYVHDFINLDTEELIPEYKDISDEQFILDPEHIEVSEYSFN
jgi:hypothetical protein